MQPKSIVEQSSVPTITEALTLSVGSAVNSVAFSPDGTRIVTGAPIYWLKRSEPEPNNDYTAKVWDAKSGQELLTLKGHSHNVHSVAFSPDGKRIATGSTNGTKVWDAKSGQELLTLKGHSDDVNSVAFSPDGARIVTGGADATAKVWDAKSGQELLTLKGHSDNVNSVAFSPDGTRIVTGSYDHTGRCGMRTTEKSCSPSKGIFPMLTQLPFLRMAGAL